MALVDQSSPGFVVNVISLSPEARIKGRPDPRTSGQVLDRMSDLSQRVISFTFEDCELEHDVVRLRVDNHDLYFFDHPAWTKGNLIRFIFGYPGRLFGPRTMVIDSWKGFLELEITCIEQTALVNEMKTQLWQNMTRADVIISMVSEGAFGAEVTSVDVEGTILASEKPRDWQQSKQTDWQFAQRLAEEPGYQVYVEGDTLHFHPRRLAFRPVRKFEYFYGQGQLLEFEVDDFKTTDRPGAVNVVSRDPLARTNLSSTGSDSTTSRPTLGNQNSLVIERNRKTGALVSGTKTITSPNSDPATVRRQADSHFSQSEMQEVKATAKIEGDPLLLAKKIIEIQGVSRLFSGNYFIEKHVHTIDQNGYKGVLTLLKNAMTAMPTSDPPTLDKSKAKENLEKVPDDRRKTITRDPFTGELKQR